MMTIQNSIAKNNILLTEDDFNTIDDLFKKLSCEEVKESDFNTVDLIINAQKEGKSLDLNSKKNEEHLNEKDGDTSIEKDLLELDEFKHVIQQEEEYSLSHANDLDSNADTDSLLNSEDINEDIDIKKY